MVFVNKKIGNGFLINTVDSSKDQEHYFSNAKKTMKMVARPDFHSSELLLFTSSIDFRGCTGLCMKNENDFFVSDMRYLYRTVDKGVTWSELTSSYELYGFTVSDSYIFTAVRGDTPLNSGWNIYRAHLTSSLTLEDFQVIESMSSGTHPNGEVGEFYLLGVKSFSDDIVYAYGQCVSGSNPYGACLLRRTLNASDPVPVWNTVDYFSGAHVGSEVTENPRDTFYLDVDVSGNFVIVVGAYLSASLSTYTRGLCRTSSLGTIGTFGTVLTGTSIWDEFNSVKIASDKSLYIGCTNYDGPRSVCYKAHVTSSNSWRRIDNYSGSVGDGNAACIQVKESKDGEIYLGIGVEIYGSDLRVPALRKSVDNGNSWFNFHVFDIEDTNEEINQFYDPKIDLSGNEILVAYATSNDLSVKRLYKTDRVYFTCSSNRYFGYNLTFETQYPMQIRDKENNYLFTDSNDVYRYFGIQYTDFQKKISFPEISFKIKVVNNSPQSIATVFDNIWISFRDGYEYPQYELLTKYGSYKYLGDDIYEFQGRLTRPPFVSFGNIQPVISIRSIYGVIDIYDFKLSFDQALSDNGAELSRNYENQNIGFYYLRPNFFPINKQKEFPHSMGIYQMPNVVLGTQTIGKVGNSEDSMIQINHIGSLVKVLWPPQGSTTEFVRGYGDYTAGQKPGKLSTTFVPGDLITVTDYDHLALYGYVLKHQVGTLDDIVIRVERRPLKDGPFTVEQTVEYSVSGSVSVAQVRDLEFHKTVDYSDLSIKEISFPIDIPLTNVKDLRVSCKHKNGQSIDENKNFILWGRLIKSDNTKSET